MPHHPCTYLDYRSSHGFKAPNSDGPGVGSLAIVRGGKAVKTRALDDVAIKPQNIFCSE